MESESDIIQFAESINQDVIAGSQDSDNEAFSEQQFTDLVMDYLVEYGEIEERNLCYHQARGSKVNAYAIDSENANLDLFITLYTGNPQPEKISKSDILDQIKRLKTFFLSAINHDYLVLEESSSAYDLADKIYQERDNLSHIRLFVLTDGLVKIDPIEDGFIDDYRITHRIWDMRRLYRLSSSGRNPDPIEIDFVKEFGELLYCIPMPEDNPVYTSYLSIISGKILSDLYDKYGPRLLERNVRAYLQMRGSINKGIRKTIIDEPHMFLAYNNGVSTTAESVRLEQASNGTPLLRAIKDFQIVNGGQTTATLHHTRMTDKIDISNVFVQLKLTVLKNPADAGKIVPKISEYANSQNKVNSADFTSNYPFHTDIQSLSRSIWAPAKHGIQQESHWYFERVRGQYQDEMGRLKTPRLKRIFSEQNPTSQRFSKTDLAKYENSWKQLPYLVSLGAEKNYREFMIGFEEVEKIVPDEIYFRHLISRAILFKKTDKIVFSQHLGGYKANTVTYSIALLSVITQGHINFVKIWKDQDISPELHELLVKVTQFVHHHIVNPPGGKNVTERCKSKECWEDLLKSIPEFLKASGEIKIPELIPSEKNDVGSISSEKKPNLIQTDPEKHQDSIHPSEVLTQEVRPITKNIPQEKITNSTHIKGLTPQGWTKILMIAKDFGLSEIHLSKIRRMYNLSVRHLMPSEVDINNIIPVLEKIKVIPKNQPDPVKKT